MDPGIKVDLPVNYDDGGRKPRGVTGQQLIDALDAIPGLVKRIFRLVRIHGGYRYYNVGLYSNQSWDAEFLLMTKALTGVASTEIRKESLYAYLYITCEYPVTINEGKSPRATERQFIDDIVSEILDFHKQFEDSLRQVIAKSPSTIASTGC